MELPLANLAFCTGKAYKKPLLSSIWNRVLAAGDGKYPLGGNMIGILGLIVSSAIFYCSSSYAVPSLTFEYAEPFDMLCGSAAAGPAPISQDAVTLLQTELPRWELLFQKYGTPLLAHTESLFAREFKKTDLIATYTLCPEFRVLGISNPLLFNALPFLKNLPTDNEHTLFVSVVYHELVHRFLDENYRSIFDVSSTRASKLISKYRNEDAIVLAHLHLFAVMNLVYVDLKMNGEWAQILAWMQGAPGTSYQRALEIVQIEGAQAFAAELQ